MILALKNMRRAAQLIKMLSINHKYDTLAHTTYSPDPEEKMFVGYKLQ